MSGSVNKVIIVGRCGKDPEIRTSHDGKEIANLSLATSESWKDKNTGERREKTEWHKVSIFNERLAAVCRQYVRKGSQIYIEGALQTRKFTDNQGKERYVTEVVLSAFNGTLVLLDSKKEADERQEPRPVPAHPQAPSAPLIDDEITF